MTFRTRILLACLAAAAVPLLILAAGARHVVRERLTVQYRDRVEASSELIRRELAVNAAWLDARLDALAQRMTDEPVTRAALLGDNAATALLDYAPDAMTLAGLDYLLLLDDRGTVLSSGHFRNDYGRSVPSLAQRLAAAAGPALVEAHRPAGPFIALVRARPVELGARRFTLVGGVEIDSTFVPDRAEGPNDLTIALQHPGSVAGAPSDDMIERGAGTPVHRADGDDGITGSVAVPFVAAADAEAAGGAPTGDETGTGEAHWIIHQPLDPLRTIIRVVDRWFAIALGAALLLAFAVARVLAGRVTQSLEQLARNASRVELTRYDIRLGMRRRDEIGALSRLLDRMVQRMRAAAQQLRDAERRATVGDMARQVNHDIRNGLLPIRNVIHHLAEVAEQSPAELGSVFNERAGTLQGGIGYLENLATNYARLTPRTERQPCDVNAVLETLRDSGASDDDRVAFQLSRPLPRAVADPVALRRVLENLIINALESLPDAGGRVIVRTAEGGDRSVLITVSDTGTGIAPDALDRIFDDFYTTRERGTGLGLSIVRRLVTDMGGRIRVQSEPGRGTTFTAELPTEG